MCGEESGCETRVSKTLYKGLKAEARGWASPWEFAEQRTLSGVGAAYQTPHKVPVFLLAYMLGCNFPLSPRPDGSAA